MSTVRNPADGGSDKMHSDEPWKPPVTKDGSIDWNNMGDALPPRDPSLGFYLNKEEKRADEQRTSKLFEDMRRMEEAKLETAKLKAGVPLTPPPTDPTAIRLEWAMPKNLAALRIDYLVDPFLPARCVVGFFGRGSVAKSSFLATLAARISDDCSTLWVSVEELKDWITQRHLYAGGAVGTLAVVTHTATKRDAQGRVIGSTFDVYRDLEASILAAKQAAESHYDPPRRLRLVVLDTAVGLTTWAKGENANDDGAVKRLLAYMQALAEQHDICIAFVGHSNKGKHDYFADTVAGSSAWTNSPRLSFVHARDRREEYSYVMRVAKTNLSSFFAVAYHTEPVLTLHQHEGGQASVLCRVVLDPVVWGADASMDLFEAATRKPDDESEGGGGRQTLVENVIMAVVELVYGAEEPVTREMVHARLGREIGRREWSKIDGRLRLAEFQYRIAITSGPQNKAQYSKLG
ncbi:AAA family ATPase [Novosphingobium sp. SCN 63-17]|uniref:AAA family ATPase n=1 Tax=Novosphingobium sp. SCN 63-17 TaxID=1660120 RepID=UPI000B2AFEBD|nr:AAA family ATPase [Novosphingobium sp. SCN 63-17]